jgi:hypothetical protein
MTRSQKKQGEAIENAARAGIGRALKNTYSRVPQEALPSTFAALLMRLESAERIARIKTRLERLRQGLTSGK